MTLFWISKKFFPRAAPVPTAPAIFPAQTLGMASSSLSLCLSISAMYPAILNPNVIGMANCACVLPISRVSLSLLAILANV